MNIDDIRQALDGLPMGKIEFTLRSVQQMTEPQSWLAKAVPIFLSSSRMSKPKAGGGLAGGGTLPRGQPWHSVWCCVLKSGSKASMLPGQLGWGR